MAAPSSGPQHQQGLPSISSLTNGLQSRSPDTHSLTDSTRDSGTWPGNSSKHNSANSGLQVHTLLNPDESPSRTSVPSTPLSGRGPLSAYSGNSQLPSINQGFADTAGNRDSQASMDSRRSSVDSRMHTGFGQLYIQNPQSPGGSASTSQVSLAASLRRPNGGPMSPLSGRSSLRGHPAPRVAPPIVAVGRVPGGPDPTAAKPTAGFAWAFPDQAIPEERRDSNSDESSTQGVSRANSFAASSIRSSVFSNDSAMPAGQRRFDDDQATTHHHSMQHRTIQNLQSEGQGAAGVGNYSRTPELRVSHKLAERKRRSEMKDLFEDLNKAVPSNGGTKASKWEILTKAIDHIRASAAHERNLTHEMQRLQRDSDYAREAHKEIEMLRTEVQVMHQHLKRLDPNAPHVYGSFTQQIQHQSGGSSAPPNGTSGINLPPLAAPSQGPSSYTAGGPPAAPMQGVEYSGYNR